MPVPDVLKNLLPTYRDVFPQGRCGGEAWKKVLSFAVLWEPNANLCLKKRGTLIIVVLFSTFFLFILHCIDILKHLLHNFQPLKVSPTTQKLRPFVYDYRYAGMHKQWLMWHQYGSLISAELSSQ